MSERDLSGRGSLTTHSAEKLRLSRGQLSQFVLDSLYTAHGDVALGSLVTPLPRRSWKRLRRVIRKLERKGYIVPSESGSGGAGTASAGLTEEGLSADESLLVAGWDDIAGAYRLASGFTPDLSVRSMAPLKDRHENYLRNLGITLKSHIFAFTAVNIFLVSLNLTISTGYPWSFFVIGGWGLALLQHITQFLTARKNHEEMKPLEVLSERKFRWFRSLRRLRYLRNTLSVLIPSVSAFLFGTNLITNPSYLWAFIPLGAMVFGLGTLVYSLTEIMKSLRRRLTAPEKVEDRYGSAGHISDRLQNTGGSLLGAPSLSSLIPRTDQGRKARDFALSILRRLDTMELPDDTRHREMGTALHEYVMRVDRLATRQADCRTLLSESEGEDETARIHALRRKAAEAEGVLRREYESALSQVEAKQASLKKLKEQEEILQLRMQSALNALHQLQIDVTGMDAGHTSGETAAIRELREKSEELDAYLQDLKAGFAELE